MDKIKVDDTGGFPLVLDDLDFLQKAFFGAFQGIGSMAGKELTAAQGFIISGCERTVPGGVTNIAAGFIYLQGEVYQVDAHTFTEVPANTEHWVVLETNDPNGLKIFQDTTSKQTYKVRKAEVITLLTPPADFMPAVAQRIGEVVLLSPGSEAKFILVSDFKSSDTFGGTKTIQSFVPSTTQDAALGMAIWQFHINLPGVGGADSICTFRIDRNAVNLQNSVHTIEDDGNQHIITVIAFLSYTKNDVLNFTAAASTSTVNFVNGYAGFISLSASKP